MPATDVRLDFPSPPTMGRLSSASGGDASLLGPPLPTDMANLMPTRIGGASLRTTTYLSERLWVTRSGDDGGLLVLRRTEAEALRPPSRKLYGKVYSQKYSE